MKHTISIFILIISFSVVSSLDINIVNTRIGLPFTFAQCWNSSSGIYNFGSDNFNVFAEFPLIIKFHCKPNFTVSPVAAYFRIDESYERDSTALGGHFENEFLHKAISLQPRFIITFQIVLIRLKHVILTVLSAHIFGRKPREVHYGGRCSHRVLFREEKNTTKAEKDFFTQFILD